MSQATRFQQDLTDQNFRELSIMSSDMTKHIRKFKSTASNSDIESSSKKQRSDFIAYENTSFEEEFLLKHFNNIFRFFIFMLSTVEITSQQSEQFTKIN